MSKNKEHERLHNPTKRQLLDPHNLQTRIRHTHKCPLSLRQKSPNTTKTKSCRLKLSEHMAEKTIGKQLLHPLPLEESLLNQVSNSKHKDIITLICTKAKENRQHQTFLSIYYIYIYVVNFDNEPSFLIISKILFLLTHFLSVPIVPMMVTSHTL